MKKIVLILICILFTKIGHAQVGIGTTSPLQELHIKGVNSTIRIESQNSINNPTYNDGIKSPPAYVDGNGDIVLGNGSGVNGTPPINFLIDVPNFAPDDPYGTGYRTGKVINNTTTDVSVEGEITTVIITVPQDAIIEVKYGITMIVAGQDILANLPNIFYPTYDQAVAMQTYIRVDVGNNGLDPTENGKVYGRKGLYYETNYGGIIGYPYMSGQAYFTVPAGDHKLYFYGLVRDNLGSYTSVGFGGAQDYLKIRVYN